MSSNPKPMALEREIETYRKELPRLLAAGQAGRFVLIKGEKVVGTWDTQAAAIQAGRERFGLEPLAVKRIDPRDVELLKRLIAPQGTVSCHE
jgi:hypothetical protein